MKRGQKGKKTIRNRRAARFDSQWQTPTWSARFFSGDVVPKPTPKPAPVITLSAAARAVLKAIQTRCVYWNSNGTGHYWTDWFMSGIVEIARDAILELVTKLLIMRRKNTWQINPRMAARLAVAA